MQTAEETVHCFAAVCAIDLATLQMRFRSGVKPPSALRDRGSSSLLLPSNQPLAMATDDPIPSQRRRTGATSSSFQERGPRCSDPFPVFAIDRVPLSEASSFVT